VRVTTAGQGRRRAQPERCGRCMQRHLRGPPDRQGAIPTVLAQVCDVPGGCRPTLGSSLLHTRDTCSRSRANLAREARGAHRRDRRNCPRAPLPWILPCDRGPCLHLGPRLYPYHYLHLCPWSHLLVCELRGCPHRPGSAARANLSRLPEALPQVYPTPRLPALLESGQGELHLLGPVASQGLQ